MTYLKSKITTDIFILKLFISNMNLHLFLLASLKIFRGFCPLTPPRALPLDPFESFASGSPTEWGLKIYFPVKILWPIRPCLTW